MEIGSHCSFKECNALDFLPVKCDACHGVFCENHMTYDQHRCSSAHMKNVQVPVCPLCNTPVPISLGESPDVKVGRHIDNDCRSDPALEKRSNLNRCVAKKCKKRDLVSIKCPDCRMTVCIKHRLPDDHDCRSLARERRIPQQFKKSNWLPSGMPSLSSPFISSGQSQTRPQSRPVTSTAVSRSGLTDSRDVSLGNGGMSESEALQAALRMSARDNATSENAQTAEQESLDYQLALMMQQGEISENDVSRQSNPARRITATGSSNSSNCRMM